MRSSNRVRGVRSGVRRRRAGLVYLLIAFFALWILLIAGGIFWGGGEEVSDGKAGGSPGDRNEEAGSASGSFTDREDKGPTTQDKAREGGGEGSSQKSNPEPDAKADAEAGGNQDYSDVNRSENRNEKQKPGSSGTRLPRQSSGGKPTYDPLGKGSDAASLSQTDLERAKLAAFRFVDAAYDFEGKGPSKKLDYLGEVGQTVDAPEFWESPESQGAEVPDTVAARIAEYGVKNDAVFQSFKVEDTSSERVIGTATFTLDEGDGRKTYKQRLTLSRWAAVWRVLYAKPLEEVS